MSHLTLTQNRGLSVSTVKYNPNSPKTGQQIPSIVRIARVRRKRLDPLRSKSRSAAWQAFWCRNRRPSALEEVVRVALIAPSASNSYQPWPLR